MKRDFAPSSYTFPDHMPFVLTQRIDYPDAGAGGACFPTTGQLVVDVGASGTLVLVFQG